MAEVSGISEATAGVKPALPTAKETQLTPEQRVLGVVSRVEALFTRREIPRAPGERAMMCGFSSEITVRAASREGLSAEKHQLMDLHRELGIPDMNDALQHGMNIVRAGDEAYIIDISFTQFLNPETGEINQQASHHIPIKWADNPLAQELIKKGYFKLTDESLRSYLDISSRSADKSYIQAATVERLLSIDPKSVATSTDHSDIYLDKLLDGETWIIE